MKLASGQKNIPPQPHSTSSAPLEDTPSLWRLISFVLGVALCLFTLAEVNYPLLRPQSQLAIFGLLGLTLCFLLVPSRPSWKDNHYARMADAGLIALTVLCFGYVIVQTEPLFQSLWLQGQSLGNRAGQETRLDLLIGLIGLILVLEAARRSIGWALPILALLFIGYAIWGQFMPSWLFPHRGYSLERTFSQTFLQSQGIFGVALRVMFTYVFLFIIFGAFLKATGATQFIIDFASRIFKASRGGPAKIAVLSSGLMGSLSGSAVANTATTGVFTIPMMRASGFRREVAGGIEAAASSGGAMVPPVMGAAAYMMLEIIDPPVTYLEIIRAALLPALLYYLSLFLIVHFYSKRIGAQPVDMDPGEKTVQLPVLSFQGLIFIGAFVSLLFFLLRGATAFRAVSLALLAIIILSAFHRDTRLTIKRTVQALTESARDVIPLICASACVGIVIGVVTLTGVGTKFPSSILPLAEGNLMLALLLIMFSTIILGMGLPSAVCYLLMAILIGPVLSQLGVVPLAAHLFIFYFGMMAMVTPPVALAAYAASSIAGSPIMQTGLAAFRFALVGFTLPFMFVFRPELLMLAPDGQTAPLLSIAYAVFIAAIGITCFAAGISAFLFNPLSKYFRLLMFLAAGLLLYPAQGFLLAGLSIPLHDAAGLLLFAVLAVLNWKRPFKTENSPPGTG